MKVLTISVASYNCKSTLKKCLNSMVNSKCLDELEIIVVNDGSRRMDVPQSATNMLKKMTELLLFIKKTVAFLPQEMLG